MITNDAQDKASPIAAAKILQPGHIVDQRYRIVSHLASGSTGEIYVAEEAQTLRHLALKIIHQRLTQAPGFEPRFRQAAEHLIKQLTAAPDLENIVPVLDYSAGPDCAFLVMDRVQGDDLAGFLRRAPRGLDPAVAGNIYGQIGRALATAHRCGIVHGHLNPSRIFICSHKQDPRFVRITGFGLGAVLQSSPPSLPPRMIAYLSPEQARAALRQEDLPCTQVGDQFSLAALIYEMLIGRPIFWQHGDDTRDVLRRIRDQDPEVFAISPRRKSEALRRAISRDQAVRYPSVTDFLDALDADETQPFDKLSLDDIAATAPEPGPSTGVEARSAGAIDPGSVPAPVPAPVPASVPALRGKLPRPLLAVLLGGAAAAILIAVLLKRGPAHPVQGPPPPPPRPAAQLPKPAPPRPSLPSLPPPAPPSTPAPPVTPQPAALAKPPPKPAAEPQITKGAGRLSPGQRGALLACARAHLDARRGYRVTLRSWDGHPIMNSFDDSSSAEAVRSGAFKGCLRRVSGLPADALIEIVQATAK